MCSWCRLPHVGDTNFTRLLLLFSTVADAWQNPYNDWRTPLESVPNLVFVVTTLPFFKGHCILAYRKIGTILSVTVCNLLFLKSVINRDGEIIAVVGVTAVLEVTRQVECYNSSLLPEKKN